MKVKINSIDEFCTSLKAGYKLKDNNGLFMELNKLGEIIIEDSRDKHLKLQFFNVDNCFCYKPDPIKIECGKSYRTRNGEKATVSFYYKDEEDYPFSGLVFGECDASYWDKYGRAEYGRGTDIVAEWKED